MNGPGKVGLEFIRLMEHKKAKIRQDTGLSPVLWAVVSRRGALFTGRSLDVEDVTRWRQVTEDADAAGAVSYEKILDSRASNVPGIVVEATPTELVTGEPGLFHVRTALQKGYGIISLAKGPLVVAFQELRELARQQGVGLRYSGAVAAALPTIDTAQHGMALSCIERIEGVLNGTTNFILNEMGEGRSYAQALAKAQAMGVAEADPRLDVEGWDSAAKMLIIANTIWGRNLGLSAVHPEGIVGLDAEFVRNCSDRGTPIRLVARATLDTEGKDPRLFIGPEVCAKDHPFSRLPGTTKAIRFSSGLMGDVIVSGGASDVTGAAASALKDLYHEMVALATNQRNCIAKGDTAQ